MQTVPTNIVIQYKVTHITLMKISRVPPYINTNCYTLIAQVLCPRSLLMFFCACQWRVQKHSLRSLLFPKGPRKSGTLVVLIKMVLKWWGLFYGTKQRVLSRKAEIQPTSFSQANLCLKKNKPTKSFFNILIFSLSFLISIIMSP